jgi:cholesterol transport system auxiliary component
MNAYRRSITLALPASLLSACSGGLWPAVAPLPTRFALEEPSMPRPVAALAATGPVLLMAPPSMAAELEGVELHYVDAEGALHAYADNAWSAPPARLLQPLLQRALEGTGAFAAVLMDASAARPALRLETHLARLQHDLQAGQFTLQLSAVLIELRTRKTLGTQTFSLRQPVERANAASAVRAARQASQQLAAQLARWCARLAQGAPAH